MGIKIWAYIILAGMIIGAVTWGYNAIHDAGYNEAVVDMAEKQSIAIDAAIRKEKIQWEASAAAAAASLDNETEIEDNIRDVEINIPAAVNSVAPDCRDLGADVLSVFNDAIAAGNNEEPASEDSAVSDEEM